LVVFALQVLPSPVDPASRGGRQEGRDSILFRTLGVVREKRSPWRDSGGQKNGARASEDGRRGDGGVKGPPIKVSEGRQTGPIIGEGFVWGAVQLWEVGTTWGGGIRPVKTRDVVGGWKKRCPNRGQGIYMQKIWGGGARPIGRGGGPWAADTVLIVRFGRWPSSCSQSWDKSLSRLNFRGTQLFVFRENPKDPVLRRIFYRANKKP